MKDYIINSLTISFFSGIGAGMIGLTTAWLNTIYDYKYKKLFKLLLILPLAFPPYIMAYIYSGFFGYTGLLSTTLREWFSIDLNIDIMNIPGAIFIFTFTLYPYVYLISRSAFKKQASQLIEISRSLGKNNFETFFKVLLPVCRTAITASIILVVLEVLNDYGVVKYFGINTFSTAIFKVWLSMGEIETSLKLAAFFVLVIFTILMIEKILKGRKRFNIPKSKPIKPELIIGKKSFIIHCINFIPIFIGFTFPFGYLIYWTVKTFKALPHGELLSISFNTLSITLISATVILFVSIIVANTVRLFPSKINIFLNKISLLGYSIPASVISISVLTLFISIDRFLAEKYARFLGQNGLILSGTLMIVVFAYLVRFFSISYNPIFSGFEKIGKNSVEICRSLGFSITKTFFKVDLPQLLPAIMSAFILLIIDILKELPIMLILRPFNYNTLATRVYEYADDEMIFETSTYSVVIILIGITLIYVLHMIETKRKQNETKNK